MKKLLFFILGLFIIFTPTVFAVSSTNLTAGSDTDGNSTATTTPITTTGTIFIAVASRTGTGTNPNQPTVTGNGLAWSAITTSLFDSTSSSRRRVTLFMGTGTPSTGSLGINFSGQNQTEVRWIVDQFTGLDANPIVQSAINQDTSGSVTNLVVPLLSFSNAANLSYGIFADAGSNVGIVGSGFTQLGQTGAFANTVMTVSEIGVNDSTVDYAFTAANEKGGIAIELKPAITSTPTITPTPTPTVTLTPTPTAMPIISSTPTVTPTITTATPTSTPTPTGGFLNRPDHTVMVIEENRQLQQVLGEGYFTQLANEGALLVQSFASYHPSQPNYIELFAGSNLGITTNTCPPPGYPLSNNNLGNQLLTSGFTFIGYAENIPANPLANGCQTSPYAGHHLPWLYFSNIPSGDTKDFTLFPTDYSTLPTFSYVIPNANDNAHDGTVAQAASWLHDHMDGYKQWAMTHNSLLIIHFDEDDDNANNLVYTVFVGPMVKKGIYNEHVDHKNILSTIEDLYGLSHLSGQSGITDIFN